MDRWERAKGRRKGGMAFADLVRVLCRHPFSLRPKDVGELTVWQAKAMLARDPDEQPPPMLPQGPVPIMPR